MQEKKAVDWPAVVEQIRRGDTAGEETLYRELSGGARLFLQRKLGTADVEDYIHDVFLIVIETIRRGQLRESERLMGFVRTVLHRQFALAISRRIGARETASATDTASRLAAASPNPEEHAIQEERVDAVLRGMRRLSETDVEILNRFYLRGESPESICQTLDITPSQFNVRKSRAKASLTESVRRDARRRIV